MLLDVRSRVRGEWQRSRGPDGNFVTKGRVVFTRGHTFQMFCLECLGVTVPTQAGSHPSVLLIRKGGVKRLGTVLVLYTRHACMTM